MVTIQQSLCERGCSLLSFFFNDTATTEIYTLSLHDALPISPGRPVRRPCVAAMNAAACSWRDRKSTRLNSSHVAISYAVFCLKKKNNPEPNKQHTQKQPHTTPTTSNKRQ